MARALIDHPLGDAQTKRAETARDEAGASRQKRIRVGGSFNGRRLLRHDRCSSKPRDITRVASERHLRFRVGCLQLAHERVELLIGWRIAQVHPRAREFRMLARDRRAQTP